MTSGHGNPASSDYWKMRPENKMSKDSKESIEKVFKRFVIRSLKRKIKKHVPKK